MASKLLLVERGAEPFAGRWALPGGWIHVDEDTDLDAAAQRVLKDKTGVETPYLEQLQSLAGCRDPRGWSLSVTYVALIAADQVKLQQGANAADVAWWPVTGDEVVVSVVFDHAAIIVAPLWPASGARSCTRRFPCICCRPGSPLANCNRSMNAFFGRRLD